MSRAGLGRILLLLALLAAIALAVLYRDRLDAAAIDHWVAEAGAAGPLLFMALYVLATVLFLPGSVLTLAGGALFGPVLGTLYSLTAATLGAGLAFLVARHLAGAWVVQRAGKRSRQLIDGVEAEGWRFVAFTRLVPLFPFNLLNYALGLTPIRFGPYLLTSYLCMLPGAFAYSYLGHVGHAAVGGAEDLAQQALLALALVSVLMFLPRLIGRLRRGPAISVRTLHHQLSRPEPPLLLDVREAEEFNGEGGHITGAVNLPLSELDRDIDQLIDHIEQPVALICRKEKRSIKAANRLSQYGFHRLHVVEGGMTAWHKAGLPCANGAEPERNTVDVHDEPEPSALGQ